MVTGKIVFIILLATFGIASFLPNESYSFRDEKIDICEYFSVTAPVYSPLGETISGMQPKMSEPPTALSKFVASHNRRFEYIQFKHFMENIQVLWKMTEQYRDYNELRKAYCELLRNDKKLETQFSILSNSVPETARPTFSKNEMMKTAALFFYWKHRSASDSSLVQYTCIGNNGARELKGIRDYTTLEAFAYEAIFENISERLQEKLWGYGTAIAEKEKNNFVSFAGYLEKVKTETYRRVEKDEELKELLLKHYRKHKRNFGFIIN